MKKKIKKKMKKVFIMFHFVRLVWIENKIWREVDDLEQWIAEREVRR